MRWRKLVTTVVVLLSVGGFAAWRMVHRCDPQLVGQWLVTYDRPATEEELRKSSIETTALARARWSFYENGTGREMLHYFPLTTLQVSSEGTATMQMKWRASPSLQFCRWWTEENRLIINWGDHATGWRWIKAVAFELLGVFSGGTPTSPIEDYSYVIEQPRMIRIELQTDGQEPAEVLYLTRLDRE